MNFQQIGEYLVATRITGPTHNMLQLQFASHPNSSPSIDVLPGVGPNQGALNSQEVLRQVIAGVEAANIEFKCDYRVGRVRFVENDSRPESVYKELAAFIVGQVVHG
ncbi:hypothetical protein [Polaromonas sp. LjRoot131]|uniref:hypothetical protein n=1 Tax=Polaromonas sp. LjRoot131 TaxID=3342262 RepID=UPI003ECEBB7E